MQDDSLPGTGDGRPDGTEIGKQDTPKTGREGGIEIGVVLQKIKAGLECPAAGLWKCHFSGTLRINIAF